MNRFTLPPDARARLGAARAIAVLTGAGISAESGLATFRGAGGIWQKFRPQELANMEAFLANPERVWEWYSYRRSVLAEARPNPAHVALAEWQVLCKNFTLITQNVDGLHQAAGSADVLELHGNIRLNRCLSCAAESFSEPTEWKEQIPHCSCGGRLRPGVVWFGEYLPEDTLARALEAARSCDLFLTIGTSALVYPAAALPELAVEQGAFVVEINPEPTPFSPLADLVIHEAAGVAVPALLGAWQTATS